MKYDNKTQQIVTTEKQKCQLFKKKKKGFFTSMIG